MRATATDPLWTALTVIAIEGMRLGVRLVQRPPSALRLLRAASVLLIATIPLGLLDQLLMATHITRVLRVLLAVADIAIDVAAMACVLLAVTSFLGGPRPPRGPRHRRRDRAAIVRRTAPVVVA